VAEDPTHADAEAQRVQRRETVSGGATAAGPENVPTLPHAALLCHPNIAGRGNAPVRQAQLLQLQRTYGNRVAQRYLAARPPVAIQRVEVGKAPPTLASQLNQRVGQMAKEAGITPKKIVDEMIRLIRADILAGTIVIPAPPDHPLAPVPIADIILRGLQSQLAVDNSGVPEVGVFKMYVSNQALVEALQNNKVDQVRDATETLLDPYVSSAERSIYTSAVHNPNAELRAMVGATTTGGNQLEKAATTHLANNVRGALHELSIENKTALSSALKEMPVVKRMLAGTLGTGGGESADLLNGMEETGGAHITEQFIKRVTEGLTKLGDLVESGKLPPKGRVPNIEVNPDKIVDKPDPSFLGKLRGATIQVVEEFRADANRDNNRVRLSALTDVATVVHEFGHQVEFFLSVEEWRDIQDLLRMRHTGGKLVSIYPNHSDSEVRKEPAFNATMPATGAYSAKAYDDGSTEIMSMTLEYFSTPANAAKVINDDPLQAAIILRLTRPTEFNLTVPQPLRALLPRGAV